MTAKQIVLVLIGLAMVACADNETNIAMEEVPPEVRRAAEEAVPGILLTEAEVRMEDDVAIYELEGELDTQRYDFDISANGEVLEMEVE